MHASVDNEWSEYLDGFSTHYAVDRIRRISSDNLGTVLWDVFQIPVLLCLIGVSSALISYGANVFIIADNQLRWHLVGPTLDYTYWCYYCLWCTSLSLLACFLTRTICREASGSGLPEMKTILSGIIKPVLLSFRLILAKILGMSLALISGLSVGKEGPFVQVSGTIADQFMRLPIFINIHRQDSRRLEIIACACASGVAATFGTSYGSVLFSIELTSSAYLVRTLPKAFLTSLIAMLVFFALGVSDQLALFNETIESKHLSPTWYELLAFLSLGVACGLLGVIFVVLAEWLSTLRNRLLDAKKFDSFTVAWRSCLIVGIISLLVSMSMYYELTTIPPMYIGLVSVAKTSADDSSFTLFDYLFQKNDMRPMLEPLAIYFVYKFLATAFCVSLPLPVGLFTPIFLTGGVFGRIVGERLNLYPSFPNYFPWEYSLLGAAGLATGVTRAISTAVIVYELSGQPHLRLPIGIVVMTAYFVGNRFSKMVYEVLIDTNGTPYMQELPKSLHHVPVSKAMLPITSQHVLALDSTYGEAMQFLAAMTGHSLLPSSTAAATAISAQQTAINTLLSDSNAAATSNGNGIEMKKKTAAHSNGRHQHQQKDGNGYSITEPMTTTTAGNTSKNSLLYGSTAYYHQQQAQDEIEPYAAYQSSSSSHVPFSPPAATAATNNYPSRSSSSYQQQNQPAVYLASSSPRPSHPMNGSGIPRTLSVEQPYLDIGDGETEESEVEVGDEEEGREGYIAAENTGTDLEAAGVVTPIHSTSTMTAQQRMMLKKMTPKKASRPPGGVAGHNTVGAGQPHDRKRIKAYAPNVIPIVQSKKSMVIVGALLRSDLEYVLREVSQMMEMMQTPPMVLGEHEPDRDEHDEHEDDDGHDYADGQVEAGYYQGEGGRDDQQQQQQQIQQQQRQERKHQERLEARGMQRLLSPLSLPPHNNNNNLNGNDDNSNGGDTKPALSGLSHLTANMRITTQPYPPSSAAQPQHSQHSQQQHYSYSHHSQYDDILHEIMQYIIITEGGKKIVPVAASTSSKRAKTALHDDDEEEIMYPQQYQEIHSWKTLTLALPLDPSPYQIVDTMQLSKVDLLFRMLSLNQAYVTHSGRLVGLITRSSFREYLGRYVKRPLDRFTQVYHAIQSCLVSMTIGNNSSGGSNNAPSSSALGPGYIGGNRHRYERVPEEYT